MKNRHKVTLILLLAVIVLAGVLLYIGTLDRRELKESPELAPLTQEEVFKPEVATELKDEDAESEPEEEVDLRVKVGLEEFPVIFEDGDYENLDKANLIWTVNNLFASGHDFEIIEEEPSVKFHVSVREVESKFYLYGSGIGYRPKIEIRYNDIVEVDGVNHLVLSREFIEAFIETSAKYAEITDELNDFIDRLNRVKSDEINNLTEAQIESMVYLGPRLAAKAGLEQKKRELRQFTVDIHFQTTNVFWIKKGTEKDLYPDGDETKPVFGGNAIYYRRDDYLRDSHHRDRIEPKAPPPSNFDPRLHTDPDAEPFIWVPIEKWEFICVDRKWKIASFMPGT